MKLLYIKLCEMSNESDINIVFEDIIMNEMQKQQGSVFDKIVTHQRKEDEEDHNMARCGNMSVFNALKHVLVY